MISAGKQFTPLPGDLYCYVYALHVAVTRPLEFSQLIHDGVVSEVGTAICTFVSTDAANVFAFSRAVF